MSKGIDSQQSVEQDGAPRRYSANTKEIPGNSLSSAIAITLARAADENVLKLSPLHETIDVAALDAIFRPYDELKSDRTDTYLCFVHDGYRVRVYSDGRIVVQELRE